MAVSAGCSLRADLPGKRAKKRFFAKKPPHQIDILGLFP
jgi:hypothetical protein